MLTVILLSAHSAKWLLAACTTVACIALTPTAAGARDGTNLATGAIVSIDDGARLQTGNQIDVFDFTTGQSVSMQIEQISQRPAGLQIRVLDPQSGRNHTLLMER